MKNCSSIKKCFKKTTIFTYAFHSSLIIKCTIAHIVHPHYMLNNLSVTVSKSYKFRSVKFSDPK